MPRIDHDRLIAWYDAQAPLYRLWRDAPDGPLVDEVESALGDDDGPRELLDLGCGTGMFAVGLTRRRPGWRVTGVDASAGMVRVAAESARRHGVADRASFRVGDAGRLDLGDAAVDAVVMAGLLPNLNEWAPALGEVRRVLRPGGRLVVVEVDRERMGGGLRAFFRLMILAQRAVSAVLPRYRFAERWNTEASTVDRPALLEALAAAGFAVERERRAHAHLVLLARAAPI